MSKYNMSEEEWKKQTSGTLTVVKKLGESLLNCKSSGRIYHYSNDRILIRCSCGNEFEGLGSSFMGNSPQSCRRCSNAKEIVGRVVNGYRCESISHQRFTSGRSRRVANLVCVRCGKTKPVQTQTFLSGKTGCSCGDASDTYRPTNMKRYFAAIVNSFKKRKPAISSGMSITIDYITDLLNQQNSLCKLSGMQISMEDGTASLDRIDSSLGYHPGNVQWVHRKINYMKRSFSEEEFVELCNKVCSYALCE